MYAKFKGYLYVLCFVVVFNITGNAELVIQRSEGSATTFSFSSKLSNIVGLE